MIIIIQIHDSAVEPLKCTLVLIYSCLYSLFSTVTAVSSDSRPPNAKCLTAIIVFDI